MSMTESEAIEWLGKDTSPMKIHVAEMKNENPMEYINEAIEVAIASIEELEQYRAIGTVSEFRELKEKATAKKVKGISLTHESRVGNCPYCHQFVMEKYDKSCPKCGTNLDWSEGKE